MELTGRRFAAFMAIGLGLAVVLGLVVWKLPDTGVSMASDKSDYAGQPVAPADASKDKTTPESTEKTTSVTTQNVATTKDASPQWNTGSRRDPLAPRNAKLSGTAGQATREQEADMYRPSNVAPQVQAQPRFEEDSSSETSRRSSSPSVIATTPSEPTPDTTKPTDPTKPTEPTDKPIPAEEQSGEDSMEIPLPGADSPSDKDDHKDADAGKPAAEETKPRPEDPFSASTRESQAPSLASDNS
ncbi:hypothetical protein [Corynebacterium meitnerae]|uniref:Uncharacterized protein n=1 Tax=Corynebacterium meitnerae TaxID=2913498 RepID=A0A9X3RIM5_9CORY|nr:hypothetical protein [Corynebacterium meitnerae]MCZ9293569.1 hypothetical protein [Corynebacterium meitnerae]